MRIRLDSVPPIMGPDGARLLREELTKARDQVGAVYSSEVVTKIHETKPFKPIDQGTLHSGIRAVPMAGTLKIEVTPSPVTERYAVVQALGRRPGQPGPPVAPILAWVQRKFGESGALAKSHAFAVARKLHRTGMVGRYFFKRARESVAAKKKATLLVQAAVRRWKRRVA